MDMSNPLSIFDLHNAMRNSFYDKQPEKYIAIDEGWYKLVLDCHNEIVRIDPEYRIFQIKEKFGVLRYYFELSESYWQTPKDQRIDLTPVIARYEAISRVTCEATGRPGVLMQSPNGWFKTLNPRWAAQNPPYNKYVEVTVAGPTGPITNYTHLDGANGATGPTSLNVSSDFSINHIPKE